MATTTRWPVSQKPLCWNRLLGFWELLLATPMVPRLALFLMRSRSPSPSLTTHIMGHLCHLLTQPSGFPPLSRINQHLTLWWRQSLIPDPAMGVHMGGWWRNTSRPPTRTVTEVLMGGSKETWRLSSRFQGAIILIYLVPQSQYFPSFQGELGKHSYLSGAWPQRNWVMVRRICDQSIQHQCQTWYLSQPVQPAVA